MTSLLGFSKKECYAVGPTSGFFKKQKTKKPKSYSLPLQVTAGNKKLCQLQLHGDLEAGLNLGASAWKADTYEIDPDCT